MKKIIRFYEKDGFTVIELLMAILILGVVMAAVTTMIVQSFDVFDSSTRRMSAGQLAELALSEVGGYLRTVTPYEDERNFEDEFKVDSWTFYGYHPDTGDESVEFKLSLENESLKLNISGLSERTVLNNVKEFDISKINGNEFEIYIKAEDGDGNTAQKRLSISSRNL